MENSGASSRKTLACRGSPKSHHKGLTMLFIAALIVAVVFMLASGVSDEAHRRNRAHQLHSEDFRLHKSAESQVCIATRLAHG